MKPAPPASGHAAVPYVGSELELFRYAVHWKAYFASQVRPFLGPRVLEVGAGLGGTTKILCAGTSTHWLCLEPDPDLVAELEDRLASGDLPACCAARQGTLRDFPAGPGFDTILYIDVLEHIEKDADELIEAARRLAPGGRLVVLSPAYQWLFSPFDAAIGHYRRYSRRTLGAVVPAGLRCDRLRYLDSVGVMASGANRFLMKQGMPTSGQLRFWDSVLVPLSRLVDPLLGFSLGKSILGVWSREGSSGPSNA